MILLCVRGCPVLCKGLAVDQPQPTRCQGHPGQNSVNTAGLTALFFQRLILGWCVGTSTWGENWGEWLPGLKLYKPQGSCRTPAFLLGAWNYGACQAETAHVISSQQNFWWATFHMCCHNLLRGWGGGKRPIRRGPLEAWPWLPWTSPHAPFPSEDCALHPLL